MSPLVIGSDSGSEPLVPTVVVDTNAIIGEGWWLDSTAWHVLLHESERGAVRLVVPEVVRMEAVGRYRGEIEELLGKADPHLVKLNAIQATAAVTTDVDGDEQRYREALSERLAKVGASHPEIPTLDVRDAITRAIYRRRPFNSKGSGFRDSVLWENVVECAMSGDVHFVTGDRSAFHADTGPVALHPELKADLSERGCVGDVRVHSKVADLLRELGHDDPHFRDDAIRILKAAAEELGEQLRRTLVGGRQVVENGLVTATLDDLDIQSATIDAVVAPDDESGVGYVDLEFRADATWTLTDGGATPSSLHPTGPVVIRGTTTMQRGADSFGEVQFSPPSPGNDSTTSLALLQLTYPAGGSVERAAWTDLLRAQELAAAAQLSTIDMTEVSKALAAVDTTTWLSDSTREAIARFSAGISSPLSDSTRAAISKMLINEDLQRAVRAASGADKLMEIARSPSMIQAQRIAQELANSPALQAAREAFARIPPDVFRNVRWGTGATGPRSGDESDVAEPEVDGVEDADGEDPDASR